MAVYTLVPNVFVPKISIRIRMDEGIGMTMTDILYREGRD